MSNNKFSVVGKRVPNVDGWEKVTGSGKYTVDMVLPNMLYGKILRSPHPHARIMGIDTHRAEALPGVKIVLTGKDTLGGRTESGGVIVTCATRRYSAGRRSAMWATRWRRWQRRRKRSPKRR